MNFKVKFYFYFSVSQSSYDCDFETNMCTWTNLKDDVFDWSRAQGPTGSSATGPTNDHTKGNRKYLYLYFCCDLNLSPFPLFDKKRKIYHLFPVFAEKEKGSPSFFSPKKVIHSLVCKQKYHPFFDLQTKMSFILLFANIIIIHSFPCKQKSHPFFCLSLQTKMSSFLLFAN